RRPEVHAAVADLDAAGQVERQREVLTLGEHRDLVVHAVALRRFQDLDAVAWHLALGGALRVLVALYDPDAALLVERERDRVDNVRLGGGEVNLEAVGDLHPRQRFRWLQIRLAGRPGVDEPELALRENGGHRERENQAGNE